MHTDISFHYIECTYSFHFSQIPLRFLPGASPPRLLALADDVISKPSKQPRDSVNGDFPPTSGRLPRKLL